MKTLIKLIGLSVGMLLLFASCEKEYPYPQMKEKQSIKIDKNRISKTKAYIDDDVYIFSPYEKEEEGKQTEEDQNKKPQDEKPEYKNQLTEEEQRAMTIDEIHLANSEYDTWLKWKVFAQSFKKNSPEGLFRYTYRFSELKPMFYSNIDLIYVELFFKDNRLIVACKINKGTKEELGLPKSNINRYVQYRDFVKAAHFDQGKQEYIISDKFRAENRILPKNVHRHDNILKVQYNKEDDSVSLKLCSPITKADGEHPTYKLVRASFPLDNVIFQNDPFFK